MSQRYFKQKLMTVNEIFLYLFQQIENLSLDFKRRRLCPYHMRDIKQRKAQKGRPNETAALDGSDASRKYLTTANATAHVYVYISISAAPRFGRPSVHFDSANVYIYTTLQPQSARGKSFHRWQRSCKKLGNSTIMRPMEVLDENPRRGKISRLSWCA